MSSSNLLSCDEDTSKLSITQQKDRIIPIAAAELDELLYVKKLDSKDAARMV